MRTWSVALLMAVSSSVWALSQPEMIPSSEVRNSELGKSVEAKESAYRATLNDPNASAVEKENATFYLGMFYMMRKDKQAIDYFLQTTKSSNVMVSSPSKFNLGMIYLHGKGVPVNLDESFNWFAEAAKLGNQDAMYEVYIMCRDFEVDAQPLKELAQWGVEAVKQTQNADQQEAGKIIVEGFSHCTTTKAIVQSVLTQR